MIPKVYVVLVNYNRWWDTIECLESLLRTNYPNFQVIVVENGSENHSFSNLISWTKGKINISFNFHEQLKKLVLPFVSKPISYCSYTYENDAFVHLQGGKNENLIFISLKKNKGFASGNNIGVKFALSKDDCDYVWVLNNDTIVNSSALSELVSFAKENKKTGFIGSKLFYYHNPNLLQAVGGKYNRWVSYSRHIGAFQEDRGQYDQVPLNLDYVVCASALVPKNCILEIGLMDENYILFFEDVDWCLRAKRLGWSLDFCPKSVVFHKEGGSDGAKGKPQAKKDLQDYYQLKNRLVFTRKFYPLFLPLVYFSLFIVLFRRIFRMKFRMAYQVLKFIFFRFDRVI